MKVYINERSIDRQAKDHQEAMSILTTLAKVVSKSKSIALENKSFRTKCFLDREIINGVTVKSVLVKAVARQSASEELARKFTLMTLMSRPHTEDRHLGVDDTIHDETGACLKSSCFDDSAESISGSLMISAENNHAYIDERISYRSSIYGLITSHNIYNEEMLDNLTWLFEHNPKHGSKPRQVAGVIISEMNLPHEKAQKTLTNGLKINSKIYGFVDGSWYQYHCHHTNKYHGFKVTLSENDPDHCLVLKKMTALGFKNDCGQVFL
ncbi:hypothetical protein [Pseudomonas viridiflava]|uniref:hypothetical protein n=1 Tax=Pseudomonas viridiflava TaxID=33069 RepID=UPI002EBD4149|nr:hypothetical protein [Pseudomonas viridiflava]